MQEQSRHIPVLQFLEALQVEYIVAELRSKTYRKPKDKTFWKDRVMVGKRTKISDISERNPDAPTIFNSPKELERIKSCIFSEYGLPNYHYRDDEQKLELENKDFYSYFCKDSDVVVRVSSMDKKVGTLLYVSSDKQFATVKLRDEEKKTTVHIANVSRVL
jgi:hypothetical protein